MNELETKDYNKGFYVSIGKQGSGKTALITKLLVDNLEQSPNRKVFSNYTLFNIDYTPIAFDTKNLKNVDKINILDTLDNDPDYFNNSIMLLDEIHIDLDSLDFMRKNNRRMQKFFSQLRKRKILLLGTTQYIMNLDVRLRRQCLNVFEMKHLKKGVFNCTTHEIDGYYTTPITNYLIDLTDYFDKYDTNEVIE